MSKFLIKMFNNFIHTQWKKRRLNAQYVLTMQVFITSLVKLHFIIVQIAKIFLEKTYADNYS